jgi:hypothetical protein
MVTRNKHRKMSEEEHIPCCDEEKHEEGEAEEVTPCCAESKTDEEIDLAAASDEDIVLEKPCKEPVEQCCGEECCCGKEECCCGQEEYCCGDECCGEESSGYTITSFFLTPETIDKSMCYAYYMYNASCIYLFWIMLHYISAQLYIYYCVPPGLYGLFISPFLISAPHCHAIRWIIHNGGNMTDNMWIVFGTWLCSKIIGS